MSPSSKKTLHYPLQLFSTKPPQHNSTTTTTVTSMKIKTLIHTLILSHLYRILRSISNAKSILTQLLKHLQKPIQFIKYTAKSTTKEKQRKRIFFGSFRLHYNWGTSSSLVLPLTEPVFNRVYYDSTWNVVIGASERFEDNNNVGESQQLSGYLQWLEEKVGNSGESSKEEVANEIDKLAEMFIASCHEKFILEKQESYRMFQEMLARSI